MNNPSAVPGSHSNITDMIGKNDALEKLIDINYKMDSILKRFDSITTPLTNFKSNINIEKIQEEAIEAKSERNSSPECPLNIKQITHLNLSGENIRSIHESINEMKEPIQRQTIDNNSNRINNSQESSIEIKMSKINLVNQIKSKFQNNNYLPKGVSDDISYAVKRNLSRFDSLSKEVNNNELLIKLREIEKSQSDKSLPKQEIKKKNRMSKLGDSLKLEKDDSKFDCKDSVHDDNQELVMAKKISADYNFRPKMKKHSFKNFDIFNNNLIKQKIV